MDPAHLANLQGLHLLPDNERIYLASTATLDPNLHAGRRPAQPHASTLACADPGQRAGLRLRPRSGSPCGLQAANQMLVLERLPEMPSLLFTRRYTEWQNRPAGSKQQVASA